MARLAWDWPETGDAERRRSAEVGFLSRAIMLQIVPSRYLAISLSSCCDVAAENSIMIGDLTLGLHRGAG
jgi:hypothetical protein